MTKRIFNWTKKGDYSRFRKSTLNKGDSKIYTAKSGNRTTITKFRGSKNKTTTKERKGIAMAAGRRKANKRAQKSARKRSANKQASRKK